jgi:hypothetical protein
MSQWEFEMGIVNSGTFKLKFDYKNQVEIIDKVPSHEKKDGHFFPFLTLATILSDSISIDKTKLSEAQKKTIEFDFDQSVGFKGLFSDGKFSIVDKLYNSDYTVKIYMRKNSIIDVYGPSIDEVSSEILDSLDSYVVDVLLDYFFNKFHYNSTPDSRIIFGKSLWEYLSGCIDCNNNFEQMINLAMKFAVECSVLS